VKLVERAGRTFGFVEFVEQFFIIAVHVDISSGRAMLPTRWPACRVSNPEADNRPKPRAAPVAKPGWAGCGGCYAVVALGWSEPGGRYQVARRG
ncbi:MAG: hypothetical protein ACKOPG_00050, partial [Novosphingobium sp.]